MRYHCDLYSIQWRSFKRDGHIGHKKLRLRGERIHNSGKSSQTLCVDLLPILVPNDEQQKSNTFFCTKKASAFRRI